MILHYSRIWKVGRGLVALRGKRKEGDVQPCRRQKEKVKKRIGWRLTTEKKTTSVRGKRGSLLGGEGRIQKKKVIKISIGGKKKKGGVTRELALKESNKTEGDNKFYSFQRGN